jgi:hypothetical protein
VFTLDDEKSSLLEQTITIERDVRPAAHEDHAAALAHTVAEALHEAVERVAERVTVALPVAAPPSEVERAGDAAHAEVSEAHE